MDAAVELTRMYLQRVLIKTSHTRVSKCRGFFMASYGVRHHRAAPLIAHNYNQEDEDITTSHGMSQIWLYKENPKYHPSVQGRAEMKQIMMTSLAAALLGAAVLAIAGDKVEICHFPPGNSRIMQTIAIDEKAVFSHLRHGDRRGACCDPATGCLTDTTGETVYVADFQSNKVAVIDAQTNTLATTLSVQRNPLRVALSPDGAYAYIPNLNSASVSVVRASDNTVIATVPVQGGPQNLVVTSDGQFAYVYNIDASTVSVIRTSDNTVVEGATISVGKGDPEGTFRNIAITPDDRFVYVANTLSSTVTVIRTSDNTVVTTIPVSNYPLSIASTPDSEFVYVVSAVDHRVAVIQTSDQTVVKTIALPDVGPQNLAITPDGALVYVVGTSQYVEIIRTSDNSLIGQVELQYADFATDVVSSPLSDFIYVIANQQFEPHGTLNVIDVASNTVITQVDLGNQPLGLAINADGSRVYVSDDSNVEVIQTSDNTLLATVPTGEKQAWGIAVTPPP
jgi:YVTN family beta-propeller protein